MLFNTKEFAFFFAIVLVVHWLLFKWRALQNLVLLAASMYFYYQLHFSFPIYLSALIIISYCFAVAIERNEKTRQRKTLLVAGLCIISAGLVYTKYSGLFFSNIKGLETWEASALHILVPVGISFYTFAILGYMIDVYWEKIPAEKNILTYASYISFFPHLLSGPIPSAATILPQFKAKSKATFSHIDESVGEILWGLFKKMVVADNISKAVSYCFVQYHELNGSTVAIGVLLFGIQLYADFSGYSSMARGIAGLLGINLVQNFIVPFHSTSITEYWRRWHISLTNWLYGYIFNPMVYALRTWRKWAIVFSLLVTFFISSFWHGAGWQFVIWGMLHGVVMVYEYLTVEQRKRLSEKIPSVIYNFFSWVFVILFLAFGWVFFRANSVPDALGVLHRIASGSLFTAPESYVAKYITWCIPLFVIEWIQRKGAYTMDIRQWHIGAGITPIRAKQINVIVKSCLYLLWCVSIYFLCKRQNAAEYYYFKF